MKTKEKKRPSEATPFEDVWFTWPVANRGYVWSEEAKPALTEPPLSVKPKGQPPYLIEHPETTVRTRRFPLRDCPNLFSDFEALRPTREDIQDFANKYGWLGIVDHLYIDKGSTGSKVFKGEGLDCWEREIAAIQMCSKIAEWIDSKNERELSKRIEWTRSADGVRFNWASIRGEPLDPRPFTGAERLRELAKLIGQEGLVRHDWIASKDNNPELLTIWSPGDVLGPANAWLVQRINERIRGKTWIGLILDKEGRKQPVVRTDNLLGAIWHQFYSHVIGEKKFVRCEVCRRLMDVTDSRRTKRMHSRCSMWLRNQRRKSPGEEKKRGKKKTRSKRR